MLTISFYNPESWTQNGLENNCTKSEQQQHRYYATSMLPPSSIDIHVRFSFLSLKCTQLKLVSIISDWRASGRFFSNFRLSNIRNFLSFHTFILYMYLNVTEGRPRRTAMSSSALYHEKAPACFIRMRPPPFITRYEDTMRRAFNKCECYFS